MRKPAFKGNKTKNKKHETLKKKSSKNLKGGGLGTTDNGEKGWSSVSGLRKANK